MPEHQGLLESQKSVVSAGDRRSHGPTAQGPCFVTTTIQIEIYESVFAISDIVWAIREVLGVFQTLSKTIGFWVFLWGVEWFEWLARETI